MHEDSISFTYVTTSHHAMDNEPNLMLICEDECGEPEPPSREPEDEPLYPWPYCQVHPDIEPQCVQLPLETHTVWNTYEIGNSGTSFGFQGRVEVPIEHTLNGGWAIEIDFGPSLLDFDCTNEFGNDCGAVDDIAGNGYHWRVTGWCNEPMENFISFEYVTITHHNTVADPNIGIHMIRVCYGDQYMEADYGDCDGM